jgi:nicotinamidase-related amidase
MRMRGEDSLLLLVDLQSRLAPAIDGIEDVLARVRLLVEAARALAVPILATEQNPQGLGATVPEIAALLRDGEVVEKIHFNAMAETEMTEKLAAAGRTRIVVAGSETHVCVLQTILGVKAAGYDVSIVADGVGSRRPADKAAALDRLRDAGVSVVTSEMVVFEWLDHSDRPEFRALLPAIREAKV